MGKPDTRTGGRQSVLKASADDAMGGGRRVARVGSARRLDQQELCLRTSKRLVFNTNGHHKQLAQSEFYIAIVMRIVIRPLRTRKRSSVSSW